MTRSPLCSLCLSASIAWASLALYLTLPSLAWCQFGNPFADLPTVESPYPQTVSIQRSGGGMPQQATAEPMTPEQQAALQSVQAYMQMEPIGRSPSAILRMLGEDDATAEPAPPVADPDTEPSGGEGIPAEVAAMQAQQRQVQRLQGSLIRGDWAAVKAHLETLPELAAPFVYGHLLSLLAQDKTIRPEEVPSIAAAAPGGLTAQQLAGLGMLLQVSLAHAEQPRELFRIIAAGTDQLGGEEPAARRNAARLLLAAGLLEEAAKYLDLPEEVNAETPFEVLDLASQLEFARFQQEQQAETAAQAWQFTQLAWNSPAASEAQRTAVLPRLVALLAQLPAEQARAWIAELAANDNARIMQLLAGMLGQAEAAYASNDASTRGSLIQAAQVIGDTLASTTGVDHSGPMQQALQLLATPWLNEALKTSGDSKRLISAPDDNDVSALPRETVEQSAPGPRWIDLLATDTGAMARRLKGTFDAGSGDWEKVSQEAAKLAQYDEKLAQNLIDTYLSAAVQGSPQIDQQLEELMQQYQGYGYGSAQLAQIRRNYRQQLLNQQSGGDGEGVALTRAKQVQSLKTLKEVLDKIAAAKLPAPSAQALTESFVAAHSSAEVFRQEDLETVFGALEELPIETTAALAGRMREHLAQQWRDQRVQQAAGTNRTELELAQEVVRGYELAIELVAAALAQQPDHVGLHLLAGLLRFDQSEYLYGLGTDLPTYVALRDEAFGEIEQAADAYARSLPTMDEEPSAEVYLRWFQVALGASDLAYLTRQAAADEPQIRKLAEAIRRLDEPMADQHLTLFGEALEEELANVPPPLKQRCLREALIVLGDHSAGDEARKLHEYYQQLLAEVDLHTEVDGSQEVGHNQAFGLRLSVRYSTPLGREAGNFLNLLGKQYDPSGTEVDNKEKLDEEIRTKLAESFEIVEIRFHQPTVTSRSYGRPGWRETPLAYLVLKAKDPATDTIPPMQIDVPFRDGHGMVLLPIASQKLLIDARDKAPVLRPLAELKVKQLLDTRELAEGKLRLEIVATGTGLMPPLGQIADLDRDSQVSGFRVQSIEDHGVSILELNTEGKEIQPLSERTWMLQLEPADDRAVAVVDQFTFPEVTADEAEVSYEQYADADILPAGRSVSLAPVVAYDVAQLALYIGLGVLGLAVLSLIGMVLWRQQRSATVGPRYSVPEQVTPFSLVAFLRRVAADQRLQLAPRDREILAGTIAELESRYFTSQGAEEDHGELHEVLDQWQAKAQQHFAAANGHR